MGDERDFQKGAGRLFQIQAYSQWGFVGNVDNPRFENQMTYLLHIPFIICYRINKP